MAASWAARRTGCSIDTVDVFIESAYFDANRTARTGRATGIISDARFRNERGIDPKSCVDGIELATKLILDACGGEPSEIVLAGKVPDGPAPVAFKPRDMKRLTGLDMPVKRMEQILRALGFEPVVPPKATHDAETIWAIKVPSWRPDVEGSADIVEELIRIEGYDKLPEEQLPAPASLGVVVTPLQNRVRTARRVLAARGFLETVTWSLHAPRKGRADDRRRQRAAARADHRQSDRLRSRLHAPVHAGEPRAGRPAQCRPWRR